MSESVKTAEKSEHLLTFGSARDLLPWVLMIACVGLMVVQLFYQGRIWWCKNDAYTLWSAAVLSRHNSQHLFDPYTFTHVLHGILYYWIAGLIFPRMPAVWRMFLAVAVESAWEVLENTSMVIERYREATISLDYYGDSVANSLGDLLACAAGFILALKLKFRLSLAVFLLTEIILLFWIRDSLLLNILMLVYPLEEIKAWQMSL
jgi:hypothetical protein